MITLALLLTASLATQDIDRFVQKVLHEVPDVPSAGIAVVRDGKPYYAKAFGYADVAAKRRATASTGYYIGSTTKAYTGLACAILASRGQLDLDAPITKLFPEVKMAPPLDAEKVTLRRLLTHTSGIQNDGIVFRTAFTGEHTPAGLVALLDLSTPGEEGFHYSNLGYVIASMAIERVTGRPWQRVLDDLVFTPLGMNHTTAYMSEASRRKLATPYEMNRPSTLVKDDSMMHAAGGIVTTPDDLVRWLEANVNDGRIGLRQKISAAAFAETHRHQVDAAATRDRFKASGYGFGWYRAQFDDNAALFHQGGYQGWQSNFSFMPEKKIGVAVVTNSGGGASVQALNLIAGYIYDRLLEKPDAETANEARLAKLTEMIQKQRAGLLAEMEKRSKRPWMLKHPNGAYAGTYDSPLYGTLKIEERGDKLIASIARLSAEVQAFTEPESARVELVPGNGEVLRFTFAGDDAAATSVKWGDGTFQRVR